MIKLHNNNKRFLKYYQQKQTHTHFYIANSWEHILQQTV